MTGLDPQSAQTRPIELPYEIYPIYIHLLLKEIITDIEVQGSMDEVHLCALIYHLDLQL